METIEQNYSETVEFLEPMGFTHLGGGIFIHESFNPERFDFSDAGNNPKRIMQKMFNKIIFLGMELKQDEFKRVLGIPT